MKIKGILPKLEQVWKYKATSAYFTQAQLYGNADRSQPRVNILLTNEKGSIN